MLNKIIHFSLQNRLLILVASVLLLIGGTYTAYHTEVDVFPDLNAPTVVVMTEANGMAAEEVEQLVTFPIETAVNGATNVRRVRSSSTTGFSVVWVEFDWDTDIYLARQIVSEKLAAASEGLPENVGKPTLGPQSSILGELLIVGLTADSTSMLDLRTLADWTIRPRLLSTGGVAQVAVLGGDIKEYQVRLHPDRMKHYGVTLGEVMAVTRGMNQNTNGGVIYGADGKPLNMRLKESSLRYQGNKKIAPTDILLVTCSRTVCSDQDSQYNASYLGYMATGSTNTWGMSALYLFHSKRANGTMLDGHVAQIGYNDLLQRKYYFPNYEAGYGGHVVSQIRCAVLPGQKFYTGF